MASAFLAGRDFAIPSISTVRGIHAAETLFASASPGHSSFTPSHFTLRPNFHNSPHQWVGLISERLIDFIRVHLSQTGGLTPARKIAALAEWFHVRTAWHGRGDVSPVGHAANAHLDLAVHNFGIQEFTQFNQATQEVFPGTPAIKNGYLYVNEAPGLGVDLNEELAKKFPLLELPAH